MKRVIAFSLFGTSQKYIVGMFENLRLARLLMPSWTVKIFCGEDVSSEVRKELQDLGGTVISMSSATILAGPFWRFLAIDFPGFTHIIFRDSDSRLSLRELALVEEWVDQGTTLHIIRDHPHHAFPILAGMWGVTSQVHKYDIPWNRMKSYPNSFGSDQDFLARVVYPVLKRDSTIHDAFFFLERDLLRPPRHDDLGSFVGESFNHRNEPDSEKRRIIRELRRHPFRRLVYGLSRTLAMRRSLSASR